jgi:hypothetical protein
MPKMPLANGKKTKGRQRRENRLVENEASRQVTFSKRKGGIWKKAAELAVLCRARLAIVVFSGFGRAFAFGSPSVDAVLHAAVPAADDEVNWEDLEALVRETKEKGEELKAEDARMRAIAEKIMEVQTKGGKRFWWQADVEQLGEAELPVFLKALERLRYTVGRHLEKMQSTPPPASQ